MKNVSFAITEQHLFSSIFIPITETRPRIIIMKLRFKPYETFRNLYMSKFVSYLNKQSSIGFMEHMRGCFIAKSMHI